MRRSFDGLCGLVQNGLAENPASGSVYIFFNKRRNRMKLLHWQPGGFVLYYKRLEEGTFQLPHQASNAGVVRLSYAQLVLLIDGISIKKMVQHKRFYSTTNGA